MTLKSERQLELAGNGMEAEKSRQFQQGEERRGRGSKKENEQEQQREEEASKREKMIYDLIIGEPKWGLPQRHRHRRESGTIDRKLRLQHSEAEAHGAKGPHLRRSGWELWQSGIAVEGKEVRGIDWEDSVALAESTQQLLMWTPNVGQNKLAVSGADHMRQKANVVNVESNARDNQPYAGPKGNNKRRGKRAAEVKPADRQKVPAAVGAGTNIQLKCRVEKDLYLDIEDYRQYTCVNCYK